MKSKIFYFLFALFSFLMLFICYLLLDAYISLNYVNQGLAETSEDLKLAALMIEDAFSGMEKQDVIKKINAYDFVDKESIFIKDDSGGQVLYVGRMGFEFKDNKFLRVIL